MKARGASKLHPFLYFVLILGYVYRTIRYQQLGDCSPQNNKGSRRDAELSDSEPLIRQHTPSITTTRAQRIDRSKLPYKCGLVFFYHVPSTGGATINQWFAQYTPKNNENGTGAPYFTTWARQKDGSADYRLPNVFIKGNGKHGGHGGMNHGGMNEFVSNLEPDEWRIAHCHHSSLHLNISEQLLYQWRYTVEAQGCAFIANVMFRDPLSHTLSLHKHIRRFKSSREVWTEHLRTKSEMGQWQTQLDYFLYNFLARNPDGVDRETKVQRALQLLKDHFDIVTVSDHDRYKKELLAMTGWEDKEMKRTNSYTKEISFTKKEVEEMQKLMEENGDTEFIYEVKKMYR